MPARLVPSHGILASRVRLMTGCHIHARHAVVLATNSIPVCPTVRIVGWQRACVSKLHLLLGIAALIVALVLPLLLWLPLLVLLLLGLRPLALESTKWIAWILERLHIALATTTLVSAVLHNCALLEGYSTVAASSAASSSARPASDWLLEVALLLLRHPLLLVWGWRMPLLHRASL